MCVRERERVQERESHRDRKAHRCKDTETKTESKRHRVTIYRHIDTKA